MDRQISERVADIYELPLIRVVPDGTHAQRACVSPI